MIPSPWHKQGNNITQEAETPPISSPQTQPQMKKRPDGWAVRRHCCFQKLDLPWGKGRVRSRRLCFLTQPQRFRLSILLPRGVQGWYNLKYTLGHLLILSPSLYIYWLGCWGHQLGEPDFPNFRFCSWHPLAGHSASVRLECHSGDGSS